MIYSPQQSAHLPGNITETWQRQHVEINTQSGLSQNETAPSSCAHPDFCFPDSQEPENMSAACAIEAQRLGEPV